MCGTDTGPCWLQLQYNNNQRGPDASDVTESGGIDNLILLLFTSKTDVLIKGVTSRQEEKLVEHVVHLKPSKVALHLPTW